MNRLEFSTLAILNFSLLGCSVKPVELPQEPYPLDHNHSQAFHLSHAMGLSNSVYLPKGEAEKLLKERKESMMEAGLSSSLSGYLVSFALAKSLGLPLTTAHDLASDSVESNFIMGAGSAKKKVITDYENFAIYLPYELAKDKEDARSYVFNYFVNVMKNNDMVLKETDSEFEYGTGHEFSHPLCQQLETLCRYQIRIEEPVIAYAPELLGGYKAWVWSPKSRNAPIINTYTVATWGQLGTFDMDAIKYNQISIQDTFEKPLVKSYPDWLVRFEPATYAKPPFIINGITEYQFELPKATKEI
ncbi:hypothetical protein ACOLXF_004508 [Vibrio fluvialis]